MNGARPAPKPLGLNDDHVARGVDLSEREYASLQKIASYRALVGKQAAEIRRLKDGIRDARDYLRPDEPAYRRLELALEERADG